MGKKHHFFKQNDDDENKSIASFVLTIPNTTKRYNSMNLNQTIESKKKTSPINECFSPVNGKKKRKR